ncbi:heme ABC transporter ATP-binding protein [Aureimonas mangrovi]|uniref:heme ABC transporter ATP-binding protein n=1 Tax=Aureimonas mangrovi TaxID=2758041 RepID=UPI00163D458A|nr:heme ABC transporter ATP-binding protein [Aureimonas mangrovi]
MSEANTIWLEGASVRHRTHLALAPTDIAIRAGELTVVVGPNGAGKSTLLKLMTGEHAADGGRVLIDGEDVSRLSPLALSRRRAVLPQSSALAFPFTVAEVVRLGLEAGGRGGRAADILAALSRVDLAGFSGRFYQELSGGEQQRVHLARVLCQIGAPVHGGRARFLFLDEPISSLDIRHQLAVLAIARDFARGGGGVVAVLHDLNLSAGFADRIVVLSKGEVAADGAPGAVLTDALLQSVFGVSIGVRAVPDAPTPFILPQVAAAF